MTGSTRRVLLAAAAAAALALGTAFASEWWGGLVPCALCLVERWPYRVAIALGLAGALLPPRLGRIALALVLVAGLGAVATAGTHVGVEWGLWPSPLPECAAPHLGGGSAAERLAHMPALPSKPCDEPVYAVEAMPVSFAEANLIFALAFSAAVAMWLARGRRTEA